MRTVSSLPSVNGSFPSPLGQARRVEWLWLPKAACSLVIGVLREWCRRSRDRAQFALLDERMLRDIGISRCDVVAEINKPFWRK